MNHPHILAASLKSAMLCLITLTSVFAAEQEVRPTMFKHPGILVDQEQLDDVKQKIATNREPWKTAFETAKNHSLGALNYEPQAQWTSIDCGERDGTPVNPACAAERQDARAAYTQALLWYYSKNPTYATNTIKIMNAWSHTLSGGHTNTNRALQAAWTGALWPRAAEIIRYTYDGWDETDQARFEKMLREQYLASIDGQETDCHFGNWQAVITEAKMNIAIFLDEPTLYEVAVQRWRDYVPAYIYLEEDGPLPKRVPNCPAHDDDDALIRYWSGQERNTFSTGQAQETCRDLEHLAYGIAGFSNVAETAYLQGLDLYAEQAKRITAAMEFHTPYDRSPPNQAIIPPSLCQGQLNRDGGFQGTLGIAYHHYAYRLDMPLPETKAWLSDGNADSPGQFHYVWETLTHGTNASVIF